MIIKQNSKGMVTVELALGILAATFLAYVFSWIVSLTITQSQCHDIAAQLTRFIARGDTYAVQKIKASAPKAATIEIFTTEGIVNVKVSVKRSFVEIGTIEITGNAQAIIEPGVA